MVRDGAILAFEFEDRDMMGDHYVNLGNGLTGTSFEISSGDGFYDARLARFDHVLHYTMILF